FGDGLEAAARALLEQKGNAIREANNSGGFIGGQFSAKRDGGFDLERPTAINIRFATARRVKLRLNALEHPRQKLPNADRSEAIRRRRRKPGFLKCLEQIFDLLRFE